MKNLIISLVLFYVYPSYSQEIKLPVLGKVEDFILIDSNNRSFQYQKKLFGKNWFAIFIFTKCPGVCPLLIGQLKKFSTKYPEVNYVAFSVDPKTDIPSVLNQYAKKHSVANLDNWHFLTGEETYLQKIVNEQFLVPTMLDRHTQKAILIDREGLLRGYFSLADEQNLMQNALKVLNE